MSRVISTSVITSLVLALASACSGRSEPASPPPAATQPAAPTVPGLPYTVADGLPTWNSSYVASNLADANPSTQWYTPMSTQPPIVATLRLATPAQLTAVELDNHLGSYDTSGVREVTVEPLGPFGNVLATVQGTLNQASITTVSLPAPILASSVRLTFRSNHGGTYYGLADVTLRGTASAVPAVAPPPPPPPIAAGRGLAYTVAPGLPFWNASYNVGMLSDGNPSTHWYTPMSPTFPVQATLSFPSPAGVTGVTFDNHLGSYDTSGIREVTIEALGAFQQVIGTASATLPQASTTTVPLTLPSQASSLRLTFRSNHGGPYAGLAEVSVQGIGQPAQ